MHWYLVHTKPRQEKRALLNLERQGFACYLPMLAVEHLRQGRVEVRDEPLFARYLFIELDTGDSARSWAPIRSTKGVHGLVSFGGEPAIVDSGLIEALKSRALQRPQPLFASGEPVRLTEGPFAGIEGVYQMMDGEHRALVLIELLHKPVSLRISPTGLHKIS